MFRDMLRILDDPERDSCFVVMAFSHVAGLAMMVWSYMEYGLDLLPLHAALSSASLAVLLPIGKNMGWRLGTLFCTAANTPSLLFSFLILTLMVTYRYADRLYPGTNPILQEDEGSSESPPPNESSMSLNVSPSDYEPIVYPLDSGNGMTVARRSPTAEEPPTQQPRPGSDHSTNRWEQMGPL